MPVALLLIRSQTQRNLPDRQTANTSLKAQLNSVCEPEISDILVALAVCSLTDDSCNIYFAEMCCQSLHTFIIIRKNVTQGGFKPATIQREHAGGMLPTCSDHASRISVP